MLSLDVALQFNHFSSGELLNKLDLRNLKEFSGGLKNELNGEKLIVSEIEGYFSLCDSKSFEFSTGKGSVSYFNVESRVDRGLARVGRLLVKDLFDEVDEMEKFLNRLFRDVNFIQARAYNSEYEFWQNAQDVGLYVSRGKEYAHLAKKSNGLPPPIEREVIDIENNPGKSILRDGYIECVGSVMWFGSRFWANSHAKKRDVVARFRQNVEWETPVIKFNFFPKVFDSSEGLQAGVQRDIRKVIYSH